MITAILVAVLPPLVTQIGEWVRARASHAARVAALEARVAALEAQLRGDS